MQVTREQAQALSDIGCRCCQITTARIDYRTNPITAERYDCTLADCDLCNTPKELLLALFEQNRNSDGTLTIMTYRNSYLGNYIHLTYEEVINYTLSPITAQDGITLQLEKAKAETATIMTKNADHPRKLKKDLAENATKISVIERYIRKYNG